MVEDLLDAIHVASKAKEMDWQYVSHDFSVRLPQKSFLSSATRFSQVTFQRPRRNVVGFGIDIDKDWRCADPCDAAACREDRISARDDSVPRSKLQSHQDRQECIRSS